MFNYFNKKLLNFKILYGLIFIKDIISIFTFINVIMIR